MADRELISQRAYAKRRGCAHSAVARAVAEKRISLVEGKVDPVVADEEWKNSTRARADSNSSINGEAAETTITYADARARREHSEAKKSELEVLKIEGRLVERSKVEAAVFDMFRVLRDKVMATPSACARKVVGMVELRDIELAITDELRSAFVEFERRVTERMEARLSA